MLTLLVGGARSGKSALALDCAERLGLPVTFIATAEPLDDEVSLRIERHRAERPDSWQTIEEPVELTEAVAAVPSEEALVVDCLTLWVSNLFGRGLDDIEIARRAEHVAGLAHRRAGPAIIVSNEVGSGIVPANELARRYRDCLGRVNAIFAAASDEAYLVVAGLVLPLTRLGEAVAATRPQRP